MTCLIVIAGLQSLSSSKMERHTVPEGYTFGWNNGGSNLPEGERKKKLHAKPRLILTDCLDHWCRANKLASDTHTPLCTTVPHLTSPTHQMGYFHNYY